MDGDLDISQLLALIKPLEPRRVGGDNLSGPGLGDEGWDGSMSFNTYDDYKTPYGTFTIHDYHEEGWMRGKSIYSPDKPRTERFHEQNCRDHEGVGSLQNDLLTPGEH